MVATGGKWCSSQTRIALHCVVELRRTFRNVVFEHTAKPPTMSRPHDVVDRFRTVIDFHTTEYNECRILTCIRYAEIFLTTVHPGSGDSLH